MFVQKSNDTCGKIICAMMLIAIFGICYYDYQLAILEKEIIFSIAFCP
jgi:hypothetical protein